MCHEDTNSLTFEPEFFAALRQVVWVMSRGACEQDHDDGRKLLRVEVAIRDQPDGEQREDGA
jgi:hypothetical protein